MTFTNVHLLRDKYKILVVMVLIIGISGLHLAVSHDFEKGHILARELYFVPIILSAFWFGLRGAVIAAAGITTFYFTYSMLHWQGFTPHEMDVILEIVLFNVVAVTTGFLQDRQKLHAREKLESVKALAGTVAHEMNSPLFVAMGNLELLQDDFTQDSEQYLEIDGVMGNLKELKLLIKKISQIEDVVTRDYDGTSRIVDLDKSSAACL